MPSKTVFVEFEKRANDGDYGSELSKAAISYELADGEEACTVIAALQGQLRGRVEQDLAQSANLKVRRALIREVRTCNRCGQPLADAEHGYLHADCESAERAERKAALEERRREQEQRWAEAEASAEAELTRGEAEMRDMEDVAL